MVTLSQKINLLHVMIEMQGWAIQKHLSHFRAQLIKLQNNLSSFFFVCFTPYVCAKTLTIIISICHYCLHIAYVY